MAHDLKLFLNELFRNPTQVVALAPSSTELAAEMARAVPIAAQRVVELGPGTGKITQALVDYGIAPNNMILLEKNPSFAGLLAERFTEAHVHLRGAEEISKICQGCDAVVSGLPLLSMPLDLQRQIVGGAFDVMGPEGVFVQFTYGPRPPVHGQLIRELGLGYLKSDRIWGNLPPARVYQFRRTQH